MHSTAPQPIGKLLQELRLAIHLTQEQLADQAYVSLRCIQNIEEGITHVPHISTVQQLADALRLSGKGRSLFEAVARGQEGIKLPIAFNRKYLITQSVSPLLASQGGVPLASEHISLSRLPTGSSRYLFGREQELQFLDEAWDDPGTNVISLVAFGGVGKSALIKYWLQRMRKDHFRGAERVYAWSFYMQGTTDRVVSADQFIESALNWFGDHAPSQGSPWNKGERLARLINAQRTLLVLDGLEPLQYPPGDLEGRLKDQSLEALLRELAVSNQGLCVITSRLAVTDLEDFEESSSQRLDLDHLSPEAGAQLLRDLGVWGDNTELEQAAKDFDGHSLALILLGGYLSDVYEGDVRCRSLVATLMEDARQGGHAQRVMTAYEKWFGEGPELEV